ncbi:MAG TPA: DHA2 family efflux MFS transporter permease subunit [Thermomicrobiales bacterium]|nr:DHA2 family efflux MFS transporter permease subunit [Thermomicrobiales bacterium]
MAAQPARNPWLILMVLCLAVFMLLLDTTIVNVAQRKIQIGLGADLAEIQWVLDSYILAYAVLLLSFGRIGDVFGRRRLFIIGMVIFSVASGLCGVSGWLGDFVGVSGVNALIAARVLQGIGGAFMMPQTLSLIAVAFPPERRGAAMGIWGGIVALGAVIGPVAGGLIVTNYAWEWIFLINIPVGIAAIALTLLIVPESVDPHASRRIDWGGLFLSGFGIFAVVFALIEANRMGWSDPFILGLFAAGAALLVAFVWWEKRVDDPMMKIELFKLRNFWVGNVITGVMAFGMFGIFFPLTLFLQGTLGFTPIRAGLSLIPMSLTIMITAPLAGRLTDRVGARWILVTGLSLVTTGILLIIMQSSLDTTWQSLFPALLVTGAGMGLTFAPMTAAAMREVPPRISGSASGIINTTRNIGQVLGIAVLGSILQSRVVSYVRADLEVTPLDAATRAEVVELARNSRFDELATIIPAGQADLLPSIYLSIQESSVSALHDTFLVSAAACLLGVGVAFMIRNHARAPVAPQTAPATTTPQERAATAD